MSCSKIRISTNWRRSTLTRVDKNYMNWFLWNGTIRSRKRNEMSLITRQKTCNSSTTPKWNSPTPDLASLRSPFTISGSHLWTSHSSTHNTLVSLSLKARSSHLAKLSSCLRTDSSGRRWCPSSNRRSLSSTARGDMQLCTSCGPSFTTGTSWRTYSWVVLTEKRVCTSSD